MYFTAENAGRIDYFRASIEKWKKEKKYRISKIHHSLIL